MFELQVAGRQRDAVIGVCSRPTKSRAAEEAWPNYPLLLQLNSLATVASLYCFHQYM